jgi:anti-sigma B factor antagonist
VTDPNEKFHFDVEESTHPTTGQKTITFHCHGKLEVTTAPMLKAAVKPLIGHGGFIVLDFADVNYVDSSGLGTLVGLKATAIGAGYCRLTLENMTPRVQDLLNLTHLTSTMTS